MLQSDGTQKPSNTQTRSTANRADSLHYKAATDHDQYNLYPFRKAYK